MKKILINDNSWQIRIALTDHDRLENIYFQGHAAPVLERAFFKGEVAKVLPGIQTAFVNIGQEKAGFLHISEIDRDLAIKHISEQLEDLEPTDKTERLEPKSKHELDISKILREGETILVQVSKEPVYTKGAKLSTCFTLPGRFLVLMPNIPRLGVSKKIESPEERHRLRDLILKKLPVGMGAIIRTSSEHKLEKEIEQDLSYLVDVWETILRRYKEAKPREKLHEDIDATLQVIRDHLDDDVDIVLCDSPENYAKIYKFIKQTAPEHTHKVKLYEGAMPLFEKYDLEKQIKQALDKKVPLKSGGSLIIESTEAMTVVDVNTGRYTGQSKLEETILKTNIEAAEEVVRQLRLRNIGGLIVIDFIDMSSPGNRQKLFRYLEKRLKEHDKFQSVVLKVSEFGLVQMTRKRSGKTLMQQMMQSCSCCHGSGVIPSLSTEAYTLLRHLKEDIIRHAPTSVTVSVHPIILEYLASVEYNAILALEKNYACKIILVTHDKPQHSYSITMNR